MQIISDSIPAGLEIFENTAPGYERTMHYGAWRVAILNWAEKFDESSNFPPERHMLTDEVFVLLGGSAALEIGERCDRVDLELGKIYNVRAGIWHRVRCSRDGKLLIVEEHSTCLDNSEYLN